MQRIIKYELLRFLKFWLIAMGIYLLYILVNLNLRLEATVIIENLYINIFVSALSLYIFITFALDHFSNKRLLYLNAKYTKLKILLAKLSVIAIYTFVTVVICLMFYNVRLYILSQKDYLTFFRMNLDNVGFALIGKNWREWMYPLNFILNLIYDAILLYAIFMLFHHLKKKIKAVYAFIASLFAISIANGIILKLTYEINKLARIFDFNVVKQRIHYMPIGENDLNFLSLIYIAVYTVVALFLLEKISNYQEVNKL